jgi:putative transposase
MIERGKPKMVVSDNDSDFTSNAILTWAAETRVAWHYITSGKPTQNASIDSFNGRLGDELLNEIRSRRLSRLELPSNVRGSIQRCTTTLATRMEDAFRVRLRLPSAPGLAQRATLTAPRHPVAAISEPNARSELKTG